MNYTVLNENLLFNCFPIVLTLMNLASINSMSKNKSIIRIGTFIYGVIGCVTILFTISDEKGYQTAFEWIMLYSISYFPLFETFNEKIGKIIDRYYDKNDKKQGLNYTEDEKIYSNLVTERITATGNLIAGLVILLFAVFPIFDRLIEKTSELYNLAKYNFIIVALSYFTLYAKKMIKTKSLSH